MKRFILLTLLLAGCAAPTPSNSQNEKAKPSAPSLEEEGTIEICHFAKAQSAVSACLADFNEHQQKAFLATMSSWVYDKDLFFPNDIKRESNKRRYGITDSQVTCLTEQTCGVEYEDAL